MEFIEFIIDGNSYVRINSGMKKTSSAPPAKADTVERLLDTAEQLFGQHGFDGVGVRELVKQAKVNLGAVTYHFGSKEALYIETVMRRFRPTNAERLKLLRGARLEAGNKPLPVEKIMDCMIRPHLLGLKHPNFHRLVARNLFIAPAFLRSALHKEMEPIAVAFRAELLRSLSDLPPDLVCLREMFSAGALLMFSMATGQMGSNRDPKLDEYLLKELVRFVSAGLQSEPAVPAGERPPIPFPPKAS